MYIWVGAVVEDDFSHMLDGLENLSKELGFSEHLFEMTLHISFKISFEVPESMFDQVVQTVKEFYSSLTGFTLRVSGVENVGEIVWLRYESRPYLSKIKDLLNALLLQKFHIALHEYDSDYLFHTTLFMSDDIEKKQEGV